MTEIELMKVDILTKELIGYCKNYGIPASYGDKIHLAASIVKAGYRKQSETVKEFAEKANAELNKLKILTESPLVRRTEKQRLIGEGMKQALLDAIEIINELAEQFGKEVE